MTCKLTKDWLAQAALPEELTDAPADVAAHLRVCDQCQQFAQRLHRLEQGWRDQPIPASASTARDRFLLRNDTVMPGTSPSAASATRSVRLPVAIGITAAVVAVMLLVAVLGGVVAWLASSKQTMPQIANQSPPTLDSAPDRNQMNPEPSPSDNREVASQEKAPPNSAGNDVIARLIDLNLKISDETNGEARERLFADRVVAMKADVAQLPESDRQFAESLVQDGEWLAKHTEPLDNADRFTVLADQLVDRIDSASTDANATARLVTYYEFVSTRGIQQKLDRAARAATKDEARQQQMDKILARETKRLEKLERTHAKASAAAKKEIRKILDQSKPKPKPKKRQNGMAA
jgi:hypothetical protein